MGSHFVWFLFLNKLFVTKLKLSNVSVHKCTWFLSMQLIKTVDINSTMHKKESI